MKFFNQAFGAFRYATVSLYSCPRFCRLPCFFTLFVRVPVAFRVWSTSPKGDLRLRSGHPTQEARGWKPPRQGDAEGVSKRARI